MRIDLAIFIGIDLMLSTFQRFINLMITEIYIWINMFFSIRVYNLWIFVAKMNYWIAAARTIVSMNLCFNSI